MWDKMALVFLALSIASAVVAYFANNWYWGGAAIAFFLISSCIFYVWNEKEVERLFRS